MAAPDRAVSVSDAMALARGALETVRLRVVGEVTGVSDKPGYKAVYFSLKDDAALMPCLMWRDAYGACGVRIADGQLMEVSGGFSAYAAKGSLQFQVRHAVLAGEGMMRLKVAELARRLEAEGLMRPERKRPLPPFPERIGVVTSPRGKAIHDILLTLRRRYPLAEVVVAGVQVEGEGAVTEIVRALERLAIEPGVGVAILGRGGGTFEDLMPFNAEEVARAIVACPFPVVTGIGHEPDTSIADMVADLRASTPTAAAESAVPDVWDLARRVTAESRLLGRTLTGLIATNGHRLSLLVQREVFRDRDALLGAYMQAVDVSADSLDRALPDRIERYREALARISRDLVRAGRCMDGPHAQRLGYLDSRMIPAGRTLIGSSEREMATAAARLADLSPLAILGRGYAVCYGAKGAIVRSFSEVLPGQRVRVRLGQGHLGCVVESSGEE